MVIKEIKKDVYRYITFVFGGVLSLIINLIITYVLTEYLQLWHMLSFSIALGTEILFLFIYHTFITFKKEANLLEAHHRLMIIRMEEEDNIKVSASSIEFELPQPSYTINTLNFLRENNPWVLRDIAERFIEAFNRNFWDASKKEIESLKYILYDAEKIIEEDSFNSN